QLARTLKPDLVLLDLMLPVMSGIEVTRALRKSTSMPIIMVTAKDSEVEKIVGLELGADDYITKPFSIREALARVNAVLRRSRQEAAEGALPERDRPGAVRDRDRTRFRLPARPAGRGVQAPASEMIRALSLPSRAPRLSDRFRLVMAAVSLAAPVALLLIVVLLAQQASPAIRHYGLGFLVARAWNPVKLDFGALPFIFGTVVTSALALALALPVGVGVAVFLAEPGAARLRG